MCIVVEWNHHLHCDLIERIFLDGKVHLLDHTFSSLMNLVRCAVVGLQLLLFEGRN